MAWNLISCCLVQKELPQTDQTAPTSCRPTPSNSQVRGTVAFLFSGSLNQMLAWFSLAHAGSLALAGLVKWPGSVRSAWPGWTRVSPGLGWSGEEREGFP